MHSPAAPSSASRRVGDIFSTKDFRLTLIMLGFPVFFDCECQRVEDKSSGLLEAAHAVTPSLGASPRPFGAGHSPFSSWRSQGKSSAFPRPACPCRRESIF